MERSWETILPLCQDAAALHMNASELVAYEQSQQTLIQSETNERNLWTRMRERKKARQYEGVSEPDRRTRAQQSLGPSSTSEEGELIRYLTPEETISFGGVRRCASQAARTSAHLLQAARQKLLALEAAARWNVRCGSYFYPVLAPLPQWEFRSSGSNRCAKCEDDLRWGFGPLPFKSFHPDRRLPLLLYGPWCSRKGTKTGRELA